MPTARMGGRPKASTSPKQTAGRRMIWQASAMSTAFGCLPTLAKSPTVSERPSPNMMMPRATGSPMVVNADPMRTPYWYTDPLREQERQQFGGFVDDTDRPDLLLGLPVAPADEDRGKAVGGGAFDVVVAVADHDRVREVDAEDAEPVERLRDDGLLGRLDLVDGGARDDPEVLGEVAVVEDD